MKLNIFTTTLLSAIYALGFVSCSNHIKDGNYTLQVLTTNDVHGSWFDSTYVGGDIKKSLYGISYIVDSVRRADGKQNVVLVDAGDCLQGDNAAYYYNYVDTLSPHLFPRLMAYMKYDAIAVGNHDIEAGHPVYDKVAKQLKDNNIPFLAGNAININTQKPYFPTYTIVKKNGLKVAIIGFTNPNIKAWLMEKLWKGMDFKSLIPLVQEDVNSIKQKEKPDVVIVAVHSGVGNGNNSVLESQGMDLYKSLQGVDFLVCSHDHKPYTEVNDSIALINSGSHSRYVGHGILNIKVKNGKIIDKKLSANLIPVHANKVDTSMRQAFYKDYLKVKKFTHTYVGTLAMNMYTKDAYSGMCNYMNLIHSVSRYNNVADISFAAPLTFNGEIKEGELIYNDMFNIYPFENQLYIIKMTGKQIKDYLEYSYDGWINTLPNAHLLKIQPRMDERYGKNGWSFINRSYNFDSASGLIYDVDVTKSFGSRIIIKSLATGKIFNLNTTYNVAMTSYRASGGGGLLSQGAGINTDKIEDLVVEKLQEIRNILFDYVRQYKTITPEVISKPEIIGSWKFIPQKECEPILNKDMYLMFGNAK